MAMAQNDKSHIQNRVTSSINFTLFISFLVVPIFMAIGDKIGVFLYDEVLSGTLLQFSSWIMIPMGVTNITSAILNSIGLEVKSFINYIIGGVFTFFSIMCLTNYMGVLSLPFGMGVSTTITMILNILMIKRKLGIKIKVLKEFTLFTLLSLPTLAITSFVSNLLANFLPLIFNLILSGGFGVLIFVLLCITFNIVNIHSYIIKFKEKVKIKGLKRAKK